MMTEAETPGKPSPVVGSVGRPIIILGMSRSGTSLVGDLVHRWGSYGGAPENLKKANAGNPHGYFEYRPMQQFLVDRLGLDFWSPGYSERLRERARDPEYRRQALELIATMTVEGAVWFWKEPALSVTLPFWKEIWGDEAVYVIPVRDPHDSAVSWQKFYIPPELRNRVSLVCAALLEWQYSMLCVLEVLRDAPHRLFLPYEGLVASPREHCGRLCDFLDRHRGGAGLREDRLNRMIAAVDPKLHRNNGQVDFSSRPEATAAQKALYQLLLRKIDDPDLPFDPAAYPMYEGWREYQANIFFFRQFAAQVIPLMSSRWVAVGVFLNRALSRLMGALRGK